MIDILEPCSKEVVELEKDIYLMCINMCVYIYKLINDYIYIILYL